MWPKDAKMGFYASQRRLDPGNLNLRSSSAFGWFFLEKPLNEAQAYVKGSYIEHDVSRTSTNSCTQRTIQHYTKLIRTNFWLFINKLKDSMWSTYSCNSFSLNWFLCFHFIEFHLIEPILHTYSTRNYPRSNEKQSFPR